MTSGRLDEELRRMSAVADQIGPHCLMLFNESFTGTNEREGSEIGRQVVSALLDAGITVFFVTHRFGTFTQLKRRDQLVECAIDAIVEVGYSRASVAEVARRAGVSKGVITYHFPAKDDLIQAVIADVLAEMGQYLEPRLHAANPVQYPERFIAPYLTTWTGYIQTHSRDVLALVRIYNTFRDESGRPNPAFDVRANEITIVAEILRQGQETGCLGSFDPRIMAAVMKAALDDLLVQYADNPELDLEAYGAELVALFQGATRPDHGPTTSSAPAGQQATAPRPVDLVTPEEEK